MMLAPESGGRRRVRQAALFAAFAFSLVPGLQAADTPPAPPRNIYGVHLLVDSPQGRGGDQLRWARHLVGRWGHVKTLFMDITAATQGPRRSWQEFVQTCYDMELVPVVRLAGAYRGSGWVKPQPDAPGDYTSIARAVRRVVEGLPRDDRCPLYVEIWNEPNLGVEWEGSPDAAEYACFFVQTAAAVREIGDPRIVIMNGALALSPEFTEEMCAAEPGFVHAFDVWASHPYPMNRPPEVNLHDGTAATSREHTIDAYRLESDVLRRFGRDDVRVMITETGYDLGNDVFRGEGYPIINEDNRADYIARAFRDCWSGWDEIVAVFPFIFAGQGWERFEWVYPDSGTKPDGSPTRPHAQYTAVAALAKPTDPTGAISGKVRIETLLLPIEGVSASFDGASASFVTDTVGAFYIPRLAPGSYVLSCGKEGFATERRDVVVSAGENRVADCRLRATSRGRLEGWVQDGLSEEPLAGVALEFSPAVGRKIVTGRNGLFDPVDLLPVAYAITVTKQGYTEVTLPEVRVEGGSRGSLGLNLGPKRSPAWTNQLGNASFEEGVGGGGQPGIALRFEPTAMGVCQVMDQVAFSGLCCQAIRAGDNETVIRQITHYGTAEAGKRYVASVWCRATGLEGEGARMSLDFTQDSGAVIQRVGPAEPVLGTSREWRYLEVEGAAPDGSRRLSINLHVGRGTGAAWFDDAYLGMEP